QGSNLARGRHSEDSAKSVDQARATPTFSRSIKVSITGQRQPGAWVKTVRAARLRAKAVESGQLACWRNFIDRAHAVGTSNEGCSVEVSVGGLHQPRVGAGTVRAARLRAKAVKRGQLACWRDLEDRARAVGPAKLRRSIEISSNLHEASDGISAIRRASRKAVQRGQLACWRDFEDRARAVGPAPVGCTVEIPSRNHQP